MDTKNFNELPHSEYKKHTQEHWTANPCGSNYSEKDLLTKEYFEEIEKHRYATHPWILDNIGRFDIYQKKVLEVGYGMGTDHLALARRGGIMHGIDLTNRNLDISKRRMQIYGYHSQLINGDAECMPYKNESFDFVYSLGVIHHSPDTCRIISEIHRILKPGGKCWIAVYHKNSIFFWWSVYTADWLFKAGYKKETIKERISRIEWPNNSSNMVIKLYGKKEFERMFHQFSFIRSSVEHLVKEDVAHFGKFVPQVLLNQLSKKLGWYVIVDATK